MLRTHHRRNNLARHRRVFSCPFDTAKSKGRVATHLTHVASRQSRAPTMVSVQNRSLDTHNRRQLKTGYIVALCLAAVLRLDSKGLLDFNFTDLVEKAVLTLAQRESGTDAARIYHFVVHETDDTSGSSKLIRWRVLRSSSVCPLVSHLLTPRDVPRTGSHIGFCVRCTRLVSSKAAL